MKAFGRKENPVIVLCGWDQGWGHSGTVGQLRHGSRTEQWIHKLGGTAICLVRSLRNDASPGWSSDGCQAV